MVMAVPPADQGCILTQGQLWHTTTTYAQMWDSFTLKFGHLTNVEMHRPRRGCG